MDTLIVVLIVIGAALYVVKTLRKKATPSDNCQCGCTTCAANEGCSPDRCDGDNP